MAGDGDAVAEAVLAQWAALPKTGKPQPHEHTVLAGVALSLPIGGSSSGGGSDQQQQQQQQQPQQRIAVVAIGTGTKCLGASRRLPGGSALNDCHAEALCRRALLRWLYAEMLAAAQRADKQTAVLRLAPPTSSGKGDSSSGGSTELFGGWRCELQPGVRLHLYVSQPPCGDASILHTAGSCAHAVGSQEAAAWAPPAAMAEAARKSSSAAGSFGRTGAKPLKRQRLEPGTAPELPAEQQPPEQLPEQQQQEQVPEGPQQVQQQPEEEQQQRQAEQLAEGPRQEQQQPHPQRWQLPQQHEVETYAAAQATGVVRRKPGRGDATLSLSCSDKLARWMLLGLQGSLLNGLLASPLHLASVTVGLPPARPAADAGAPAAEQQVTDCSASSSSSGELAAAAEAALRRALLDRTAALAAERLPAGMHQAAPSLHIHAPADGGSSRAGELGLAPSAVRRVAGGASVVWVGPPTAEFKWKQRQPGAFPTLSGGSVEAVAGSTGLKVGNPRPQAGQPVRPSGRPSVCKAALLAQWRLLATTLQQLRLPSTAPASEQQGGEPAAGRQQQQPEQQPQQQPQQQRGQSQMEVEEHAVASASAEALSYRAAKRAAGAAYQAAWQLLLAPPSALEPWVPKPPELEDFF